MFQHPQYPWMLADLDYLVEMPDGSRAILECKTTTSNSADNWWYAGKEIVPVYYESQGRHYMAVTNIDRVYFCCLLTDSREAIIRCMDRDMAYEEELIVLEESFWKENVLAQAPPPYTESGDLIMVDERNAAQYSRNLHVVNLHHEGNLVRLRIVDDTVPAPDASIVEPSLEDLFLYHFSEDTQDGRSGDDENLD